MIKVSETNGFTIGIIQFPGSNCDQDCWWALKRHSDARLTWIWHQDTSLPKIDALVIPGGFSYGDYLRSGALAARSRIVEAVTAFAHRGGPIIGICNGFQILTEAGLLPGTLIRNQSFEFVCETTALIANPRAKLWNGEAPSGVLRVPIAHGEGRFFIDQESLRGLEAEGQVYLRYQANPNGSVADIAGITSSSGRIVGMMPHPERAVDKEVGSVDGLPIWRNFLEVACGGL